jgi:hypothetical protein
MTCVLHTTPVLFTLGDVIQQAILAAPCLYTVIPWLTNLIRSRVTFVSRNVISRSRCLERKQPSRVGGSPLCDVVSSFLGHTHTDGKDKLLEWPDRSCLLLYVSKRIH